MMLFTLTRRKKIIILSLITILLLPFFIRGIAFLGIGVAYGYTPYGVFGGRITQVIQCTCNGGHVIGVGSPGIGTSNPLRPGRLRFVGRGLYEYGQIKKVGAWVLGTYDPPTPCLRLVCPCGAFACCCKVVPHEGNIRIVGTSR